MNTYGIKFKILIVIVMQISFLSEKKTKHIAEKKKKKLEKKINKWTKNKAKTTRKLLNNFILLLTFATAFIYLLKFVYLNRSVMPFRFTLICFLFCDSFFFPQNIQWTFETI